MHESASIESGDLTEPLRRMGLLKAGEAARLTPLTGGVVFGHLARRSRRATLPRQACAAKAQGRGLVGGAGRDDAAEAAYMRAVARWLPHAVPAILGEDAQAGWFAMDYLAPEDHPLWKAQLLAGIVEVDFAAAVGRDLAIIHSRSADDSNIPAAFVNDDTLEAIRIEPDLRTTGRAHPQLAARFDALALTTLTTKRALVHGDISPKNILQGPDGPVFLDAERAWFGDPVSILPSVSTIFC